MYVILNVTFMIYLYFPIFITSYIVNLINLRFLDLVRKIIYFIWDIVKRHTLPNKNSQLRYSNLKI